MLRESHRTRTVFRKVGGFVYVTSLLVAMERSLCSPPVSGWEKVNQNKVFELLHNRILHSNSSHALRTCQLTLLSHWDPVREAGRCRATFGMFSDVKKVGPATVFPSNAQPFQRLLEDEIIPAENVCPTLKHCSKLFIYLYKMASDSFDRCG